MDQLFRKSGDNRQMLKMIAGMKIGQRIAISHPDHVLVISKEEHKESGIHGSVIITDEPLTQKELQAAAKEFETISIKDEDILMLEQRYRKTWPACRNMSASRVAACLAVHDTTIVTAKLYDMALRGVIKRRLPRNTLLYKRIMEMTVSK